MKMKSRKNTPHEYKALELKFEEDSISPHKVYLKEHSVREHTSDKPAGKTLFIVNVPPYVDEEGLKNAFSDAGKIKSIQFNTKPSISDTKTVHRFLPEGTQPTFKVAYVVFDKVSQLDNALNLSKLKPLNSEKHQIKCGLRKWIDEYNNSIMHPKALKERVEQFMQQHDKEIKKAEEKDKQLEQEDDEGWVTVTKRGKVQSFARTKKVENKILEKEEKNKKRKELKNFYTFQIRESKMKHIVALRQKFEEDKKKIAQIKQSRRFKPF